MMPNYQPFGHIIVEKHLGNKLIVVSDAMFMSVIGLSFGHYQFILSLLSFYIIVIF